MQWCCKDLRVFSTLDSFWKKYY